MQSHSAGVLFNRINEIIKLIPNDYKSEDGVHTHANIAHALRGRQNSIRYTAPEAMAVRWQEVAAILENSLPEPATTPWAKQVANLFGEAL